MKIRRKKEMTRLNLTSVMDAIFIFIFFLLMSAQFLNIHIINSDAPAISLVKEESKELPLNLVLEIRKDEILVKTGLEGKLHSTIKKDQQDEYNLGQLRKIIIDLKKVNIEESTVTFRPQENIEYENIVKVIDSVRELDDKEGVIMAVNKKGESVQTKKLFDLVVFETII